MSLYERQFLVDLFDEMSQTYAVVNYVSSFGFCVRWRRQLVQGARVRAGDVVVDLMCGSGECWPEICRQSRDVGRIVGVDFSPGMLAKTSITCRRIPDTAIEIYREDVLCCTLPDECADRIVCAFGVKTLGTAQLRGLAQQIQRLLKPGGTFSLIEVSVPPSRLLSLVYLAYLTRVIPWIGRLCLGKADNYQMLGIYVRAFGDCRSLVPIFEECDLAVSFRSWFWGCATGLVGQKRRTSAT